MKNRMLFSDILGSHVTCRFGRNFWSVTRQKCLPGRLSPTCSPQLLSDRCYCTSLIIFDLIILFISFISFILFIPFVFPNLPVNFKKRLIKCLTLPRMQSTFSLRSVRFRASFVLSLSMHSRHCRTPLLLHANHLFDRAISLEPAGRVSPKFPRSAKSETFEAARGAELRMLCDAQAYPAPAFRSVYFDIIIRGTTVSCTSSRSLFTTLADFHLSGTDNPFNRQSIVLVVALSYPPNLCKKRQEVVCAPCSNVQDLSQNVPDTVLDPA